MVKELTNSQIYDIIEQYVEIKVDRMDTQELIERVTQDLTDWYSDFTLDELKDTIDVNDEGLFDELVVDNMDVKTMMQLITDMLTDEYNDYSDDELKCQIEATHDEDLYKELVENIQISELTKEVK